MTVDLLEQTLPQLMLFQQMAEVQNRRLVRQQGPTASTLRTVSPTRPRRACPPYQDRSSCRTTARSVSAPSPTTHMVDGLGPPWDRTDGCALPSVPTGSEHPCAPGISPGRVLRFLLSYSKSAANVGWSINYLPEHSAILYATMPRLVQSILRIEHVAAKLVKTLEICKVHNSFLDTTNLIRFEVVGGKGMQISPFHTFSV